jgi:hypothetical protein
VNPSDLSNDSDPLFVSEFYSNLKILSQDLYKKSSHGSTTQTAPQGPVAATSHTATSIPASTPSERRMPLQRSGSKGTSSLTGLGASSGDYFSPRSLNERIRNYVRVSNVPQEFADRYLTEDSTHQLHPAAQGDSEEKTEPVN